MKSSNAELWLLPLVGTELRVNADGSIWRIAVRRNNGVLVAIEPRRAERKTATGYLQVAGMAARRKRVAAMAHRIVWGALRGSIPHGMEVNHKNGVVSDNRPDNLEIVSPSANVRHRFDVLRRYVKLSHEQVAEIRATYQRGVRGHGCDVLARRYGVSPATISNIVHGQRWGPNRNRKAEASAQLPGRGAR